MANIGTLTATLGLDTSALLVGERDAVRTFNAIQASAETTTQSIAAFNAQMSAAAGATAPRHHIDAFIREAGEGAKQAGAGFEMADLKAAALGATVAGMPPVFSRFATVLAFGSAGIGALSVGVGLLLQQLFDSESAFRTWISGHEGSVKAIRSHRESLDDLAGSGLKYRDVAADLIRLADEQARKEKAQAAADLELAQAGFERLSVWHRIRNSIIARRLVPEISPVGDAQQVRLLTEFTTKVAELNKELGLTAPSMADEFTRMVEVAKLAQRHFEDQTKATKEAAKAADEYALKVHDAQEALRGLDPLSDPYENYRIGVNVATKDTEAFSAAAIKAQEDMLGLGFPGPPPSIPEGEIIELEGEMAKSGKRMRTMADEIARDMERSFDTFFFDVMTANFKTLEDLILSFSSNVSRIFSGQLASQFSNFVMGLFDTGHEMGSQIGPTGPMSVKAFASGGMVTQPTLALIGESGPEVVVPMSKLSSHRFWDSIRSEAGMAPAEGGGTVHMYISTPDVASFKSSQSQILSRAAVALARQRRNM